eukprot:scaffold12851_cov64-Phaeocystis_antarctica.AAC.2
MRRGRLGCRFPLGKADRRGARRHYCKLCRAERGSRGPGSPMTLRGGLDHILPALLARVHVELGPGRAAVVRPVEVVVVPVPVADDHPLVVLGDDGAGPHVDAGDAADLRPVLGGPREGLAQDRRVVRRLGCEGRLRVVRVVLGERAVVIRH